MQSRYYFRISTRSSQADFGPGDAAEPVGEDLKKMSRAESLCKFLIATSPSGAMDRTKLKLYIQQLLGGRFDRTAQFQTSVLDAVHASLLE